MAHFEYSTVSTKKELVKNLSEQYRMLTHSLRACFFVSSTYTSADLALRFHYQLGMITGREFAGSG